MKNTKRMISAAMALVLCLMLMPAGIVSAAEVQTGGYENGNGLDLNKIGSYISGISNPDGGVAEIVSYDAVENKAWVVNGATGMLDILDLNNMEGGAISATSLDIKALAAELTEGVTDPMEKARRFYDFISLNMKYTFMPGYFILENIAETCARNFTGDCGVFALLFFGEKLSKRGWIAVALCSLGTCLFI